MNIPALKQFEDCLRGLNATVETNNQSLWQQPDCGKFHTEVDYCNLGFGHYRSGNAAARGSSRDVGNGKCHYRAFYERKSLHISGLERQEAALIGFIEVMRKYGYTSVYLLGDSVNTQLAHFVLCDFLRSGEAALSVHACPGWNHLYTGDRHSGCNMVSHRYAGGSGSDTDSYNVSFYSNRFGPPCNEGSCKDASKVAEMFEHSFRRGFRSYFSDKTGAIAVFNTGLHTSTTFRDDVYNNVTLNLAEQLLKSADEFQKNGNLVIFRETTAQHFAYSVDGSYDPQGVMPGSFCCSAEHIRYNQTMNRNDLELYNKLTELAPRWSARLGWATYYQHSMRVGDDLHTETNKDCTHFIYNPEGAGNSLSNYLLDSLATSIINVRQAQAEA